MASTNRYIKGKIKKVYVFKGYDAAFSEVKTVPAVSVGISDEEMIADVVPDGNVLTQSVRFNLTASFATAPIVFFNDASGQTMNLQSVFGGMTSTSVADLTSSYEMFASGTYTGMAVRIV
jgi:hypothetical protein